MSHKIEPVSEEPQWPETNCPHSIVYSSGWSAVAAADGSLCVSNTTRSVRRPAELQIRRKRMNINLICQ